MNRILSLFWPKKWPSKKQWSIFFKSLNGKEKVAFSFFVFTAFLSLFYFTFLFYSSNTEDVPAYGGVYREGVVASTSWININPVYESQNDIERDIIEIVFDGLMRYDENNEIVPWLIEEYSSEENKVFEITLRDDIYWSDGEKITADDVIFTIETILNPDFQSGLLQQWIGIEIEKVSDKTVRFTLENPSAIFVENLTLKIIPKHIFEGYSPDDFKYLKQNFIPVSSGPYKIKEVKEDQEGLIEFIVLERNPYYFGKEPFIDEVLFHFFKSKELLLSAKKQGEIDGFIAFNDFYQDSLEEKFFSNHKIELPRYFSVIFNSREENALQDVKVREALFYATNKQEIVDDVLMGSGDIVNSPFLPNFYNFQEPEQEHYFDLEKAKEIISEAGFENGKKEVEEKFTFTEDLKRDSQGEDVRKMQECFLYLQEQEDADAFYNGEVTGFFDEETEQAVNFFQEKYREEILDPHGFDEGTGMVAKGTREKLNQDCDAFLNKPAFLEITITTLDNQMLTDTAEVLKRQWEELGVTVHIEEKNITSLREDVIRNRNFQVLVFGTMFNAIPNPLPLWHSTKTDYPGLNLSGYKNDNVDKILEKIISGEGEREELLFEIQEVVLENFSCIPLYNPHVVYYFSERLKGFNEKKVISSASRFQNIENWYLKTKKQWKKN
jgi:ABC-type transport system substrate-binding protein